MARAVVTCEDELWELLHDAVEYGRAPDAISFSDWVKLEIVVDPGDGVTIAPEMMIAHRKLQRAINAGYLLAKHGDLNWRRLTASDHHCLRSPLTIHPGSSRYLEHLMEPFNHIAKGAAARLSPLGATLSVLGMVGATAVTVSWLGYLYHNAKAAEQQGKHIVEMQRIAASTRQDEIRKEVQLELAFSHAK